MRYFYVTYTSSAGSGAIGLQQNEVIEGEEDRGFNFVDATNHIRQTNQRLCIIMSWVQICQARYDAWVAFCETLNTAGKPKKSHLALVLPIKGDSELSPVPESSSDSPASGTSSEAPSLPPQNQ